MSELIMSKKGHEPAKQNVWILTSDELGVELGMRDIRYIEEPKNPDKPDEYRKITIHLNKGNSGFFFAQNKLRDVYSAIKNALVGREYFHATIYYYDPTGVLLELWNLHVTGGDFYYGYESADEDHIEHPYLKLKTKRCEVLPKHQVEQEKGDEEECDNDEKEDEKETGMFEIVGYSVENERKKNIEEKEDRISGDGKKCAEVIDKTTFEVLRGKFGKWLRNLLGDEYDQYCVFIHRYDGVTDLVRVKLYTDEYEYSIKTIMEKENTYMDCVVQNRKCDVGEDWHRGSDLSDGKYNYDTFQRIIGDILKRELLKPNVATKSEE